VKGDTNIIIEKVAKKLDLPRYEVSKIVNSLCGYIFDLMEEGTFEGFYMRYLGKFIVKPKRLETMQKKLKEKQERELENFEEDPLDFS
jgi:nucleoid DNA-binding protein